MLSFSNNVKGLSRKLFPTNLLFFILLCFYFTPIYFLILSHFLHFQNNSNNTQIQGATNVFEDYVMSLFKDIINTCNQIILQEPNIVGNGGHYIHYQRTTENDQHGFFPSHTEASNSGTLTGYKTYTIKKFIAK